MVALALGRRLPAFASTGSVPAIASPLRRATVAIGGLFERADAMLRAWHVAGFSLLALALAFGAAMRAGG